MITDRYLFAEKMIKRGVPDPLVSKAEDKRESGHLFYNIFEFSYRMVMYVE